MRTVAQWKIDTQGKFPLPEQLEIDGKVYSADRILRIIQSRLRVPDALAYINEVGYNREVLYYLIPRSGELRRARIGTLANCVYLDIILAISKLDVWKRVLVSLMSTGVERRKIIKLLGSGYIGQYDKVLDELVVLLEKEVK